MGERAAGPMAKRMTSPQFGRRRAARRAGRRWRPTPLPASAVPITQGAASTRATTTASTATTRTRQPGSRAPTRSEPTAQASAGDEDQRDHGRREARRRGDHGAEDGDLARPAGCASAVPALDRVGRHAGRPGQAQGDEREGGVGDEAVPAARARARRRAAGDRGSR